MGSLKRHEGYLIVDHRNSPGLPADVAKASGFDPKHCGEGKVMEAATITCSHCKVVVVVNPLRTRERAYCRRCDHYICDGCHEASKNPNYVHTSFEKVRDEVLSGKPVLIINSILGRGIQNG